MNQNEQQPERTVLQISIQRKKDRVEFLYEECKRLGIGTIGYERCSNEIVFLSREITEDEKLLVVEKEQIENAYSRGAEDENLHMTRNCPEPSSYKYYKDKYGTDGK